MKSFLFIINKAPYSSDITKETLDMAMSLAAFDQKVGLLFSGAGVWNLVDEQLPKLHGVKEFTRIIKGLDLYDIEELYLDSESLIQNSLKIEQLFVNITSINSAEKSILLQQYDKVLCL